MKGIYMFCTVINSKVYLVPGGFPCPGSHSMVALKSNNPTVRFSGRKSIAVNKREGKVIALQNIQMPK